MHLEVIIRNIYQMNIQMLTVALCLCLAPAVYAWDGVDAETGESVTIEKDNFVRPGQDIEIYDWGRGTYRSVTVESIQGYGMGAEVEIYDYEEGEYRTLEME